MNLIPQPLENAMRKPSFENLHPNHKWAFLDGLLCGLGVWFFHWLSKRP